MDEHLWVNAVDVKGQVQGDLPCPSVPCNTNRFESQLHHASDAQAIDVLHRRREYPVLSHETVQDFSLEHVDVAESNEGQSCGLQKRRSPFLSVAEPLQPLDRGGITDAREKRQRHAFQGGAPKKEKGGGVQTRFKGEDEGCS